MASNEASQSGTRQSTTLWAGVFALILVLAWTQWRALSSAHDSYRSSLAQVEIMKADVTQIQALRVAPQSAVGQTRTSQELLHQVEKALGAAGIDRSLWTDSVPQAAVRVPDSDYQRAGVRLYLGGLTLQQLTAFAHRLHADDSTLTVSAVNVINREPESSKFDVDLLVSYLVFSPKEQPSDFALRHSS